MKKRVISAIVFGAIFFPAFIFGGYQFNNIIGGIYFIAFTMFCSYVGTFEIMNMFYKKSPSLKKLRFIVPALSALLVCSLHFFIATNYHVWIYIQPNSIECMPTTSSGMVFWQMPWLFANIFYCVIVIIGMLLFSVFKKGASAFDAIASIFAFIYGGILLGLAFSIEYLHVNERVNGWRVFTYVYAIVCFTDIFAYVIGSKFGRHKLCPTISPNKSVEGAIGGTLIGFLIFVPYICAQNVSGQKILRLKDCCYRFRKGISNLFLLYRIPKVPAIWNLGIRLAAPMVQPPRNGSSN